MAAIIKVEGVTKKYVRLTALHGISFSVNQSEAVALLGANGAGKTTLLKIILGLLPASSGSCSLLGAPTVGLTHKTKEAIGFISDESGPLPWATADGLARLYSSLYRNWDPDRFNEITGLLEINPDKRLDRLSKGEHRLTELALVLSYHPQVLIMDEPFDGLDAVMRVKVARYLSGAREQEGLTVFYTTHIVTEVDKMAGRLMILKEGRLVADFSGPELPSRPEQAFLDLYDLNGEEA